MHHFVIQYTYNYKQSGIVLVCKSTARGAAGAIKYPFARFAGGIEHIIARGASVRIAFEMGSVVRWVAAERRCFTNYPVGILRSIWRNSSQLWRFFDILKADGVSCQLVVAVADFKALVLFSVFVFFAVVIPSTSWNINTVLSV